MNSNYPKKPLDKHPKPCTCGCDQAVTWLDWLLLVLLVLVGWLMVAAAMPAPKSDPFYDPATCDVTACIALAPANAASHAPTAVTGGRYVQRD